MGPMRPAARGAGLAASSEEFAEQTLGLAEPILGEGDRFSLADRIGDEAFLVQPIEDTPVDPFPGAAPIFTAVPEPLVVLASSADFPLLLALPTAWVARL